MQKVLVVDDDKVLQESVRQALEFHSFVVDVASNGREALNAVLGQRYDLVLMDVNMPEMDGLQALEEMKKHDPSIIVLILTAYSNVADAVKAVKLGAFNYLEKPILSNNLAALIKRALKARTLVEASAFSAPSMSIGKDTDRFVGESESMKKVFNVISKLAQVNTPVLIRGESGTGKELVAKAIHFNGPRKDEKFVTVNMSAISEGLIESELFGHEKGAFTGAIERKIGKFQYADGGTIFLDEIGDVSPGMQVKLLRVLQEKTFTPVGSNRDIKADVRIIAASNRIFEDMIKKGTFREDLFYRLNVLPVYLPPLRERVLDIPHLIEYYIKYFNGVHNLQMRGIAPEAKKLLLSYGWPGNIRELRNVIEHAFIIESSDMIYPEALPDVLHKNNKEEIAEESEEGMIDFDDIQDSAIEKIYESDEAQNYQISFTGTDGTKMDFQYAKDLFEKEFIIQALKMNKGRINQTALKANIPKKTLLRKIEKYIINPKDYY